MRLITLAFVLVASVASAQTPQQRPLLQQADLVYLGSFTLPDNDGQPPSGEANKFRYSTGALSIGPDGQSLYFGCHSHGNKLARVTIPAIGGVAKVITPCTTVPNLAAIDPNGSEAKVLGGSLFWNGRSILSAHTYYDGSGNATASHFVGQPDLTGISGPVRVGTVNPGWVGGPMGVIPPEWRSLLGAPAATTLCCVSVITRSSFGPDFVAFDPDNVGAVAPVPGAVLLGYDSAHPLGNWGSQNPLFHGATKMAGFAFVGGTRSLLYFGRHGDNYCYGTGTQCNDPQITSQGNHSFPYYRQVWAYDANDLVAVKQGTKQPWEVQPYQVWKLDAGGWMDIRSVTYDDATKRVYMVTWAGSNVPTVLVYAITVPQSAPVDATYGPWSDWLPLGDWTPCSPQGSQTRAERQTREELTPAQNGGVTQPTSEDREATQACAFDATYTDWSAWVTVAAWPSGLVEERSRSLVLPAVNGGATAHTYEQRITLTRQ